MEELGKIAGSKDASFETKAKSIHTLTFPVSMGCESLAVKEVDENKMVSLELWSWGRALQIH